MSLATGAAKSQARALAADQISRHYGQTRALSEVSVTLRRGEVHGIAGHNGAGKSTLLRVLSGAEQPDAGRLLLDGEPLTLGSPSAALAAGVVCVYQELSLAQNCTVAQNIFLGGELNRGGTTLDRRMNAEADRLLEQFQLQLRPTDTVSRLPVASRQMVEILRALHRKANYILLDEPTTALQPAQIDVLFAQLRRLVAEQDVAVAMIDHKLDELYAVADRITVLADGELVFSQPTADAPRQQVIRAIVGTGDRRALEVIAAPDRATRVQDNAPLGGETILELQALTSHRLIQVDVVVPAGRVLGIYGLIGSGRTRLLRTVMGLEPVTGGRLTVRGRVRRFRSPAQAMRAGIAYVSEERKADGFIPGSDAVDNAVLPVLRRFSPLGVVRRRQARRAAESELAALDIRGNVQGPIERLSGGNQQKAMLAKALLQKPVLLLLDEPTKGIDIGTKAQIHEIIRRLAHDDGVAVVVVSSEEEEILSVGDDVAIMRSGALVEPTRPAGGLSVLELRRWALGAHEQPLPSAV